MPLPPSVDDISQQQSLQTTNLPLPQCLRSFSSAQIKSPSVADFAELLAPGITPDTFLVQEEPQYRKIIANLASSRQIDLHAQFLRHLEQLLQFRAKFRAHCSATEYAPASSPTTNNLVCATPLQVSQPTQLHSKVKQQDDENQQQPGTQSPQQPPAQPQPKSTALLPAKHITNAALIQILTRQLSDTQLHNPSPPVFADLLNNGITPENLLSFQEAKLRKKLLGYPTRNRSQERDLLLLNLRSTFWSKFKTYCTQQQTANQPSPQQQPAQEYQEPLTPLDPQSLVPTLSILPFPIITLPQDHLKAPTDETFHFLLTNSVSSYMWMSSMEFELRSELKTMKAVRTAIQIEHLQQLHLIDLRYDFLMKVKAYCADRTKSPGSVEATAALIESLKLQLPSPLTKASCTPAVFDKLLQDGITPANVCSPAEIELKTRLSYIPKLQDTPLLREQRKYLKRRSKFRSKFKAYCESGTNADASSDDEANNIAETCLQSTTFSPSIQVDEASKYQHEDENEESEQDEDEDDDDDESQYEAFREEFAAQFQADDSDYNADCQVLYNLGISADNFFTHHEQRYLDQLRSMDIARPLVGSYKLHLKYFLARETFCQTVYQPFLSSLQHGSE